MTSEEQVPSIEIRMDLSVYRLAALKKAAYKFTNRCFISIETAADNHANVTLSSPTRATELAQLSREFINEALDQELREVVLGETANIRNLLLAHAFSALSPTDPVGETADYHTDPLGIARPDR